LEGSTLGGQIVGAILRKNMPAELQATRYFDSYGDQTKSMWNAFIDHLNAFGAAHPERTDTVVRAARETFELFQQHLEAAQA
jgi:heme oxygenase